MVLTLHIISVSVEVCSMNIELTDQLGQWLSCLFLYSTWITESAIMPSFSLFSTIFF